MKNLNINQIKFIVLEENKRLIDDIRKDSKFGYDRDFWSCTEDLYIEKIENIKTEEELDNFLREWRGISLDEWIESLPSL